MCCSPRCIPLPVDFHSGIRLHILQSPQLTLLLFFSQHDGPTEKTPVSHSVSLRCVRAGPFCTSTRARKLFDEGEFLDYSTMSSQRCTERSVSDPLSHHFKLLEELTDEAKSSKVGRSSLTSASAPRHKLPSCCFAGGTHVHGAYTKDQGQRDPVYFNFSACPELC